MMHKETGTCDWCGAPKFKGESHRRSHLGQAGFVLFFVTGFFGVIALFAGSCAPFTEPGMPHEEASRQSMLFLLGALATATVCFAGAMLSLAWGVDEIGAKHDPR